MNWSESQLNEVRQRLNGGRPVQTRRKPRQSKSKYRNEPTFVDGRRFASKREAIRYLELKFMQAAGQIRGFTCQVSLPLASGKRRMVIDFMVVNLDGSIRWLDAKGYATEAWKVKRDELQHQLGITIQSV